MDDELPLLSEEVAVCVFEVVVVEVMVGLLVCVVDWVEVGVFEEVAVIDEVIEGELPLESEEVAVEEIEIDELKVFD